MADTNDPDRPQRNSRHTWNRPTTMFSPRRTDRTSLDRTIDLLTWACLLFCLSLVLYLALAYDV